MYCSSVRTNTCRVDLLYMQENLADRRKVQNMCVEAFRTAARPSSIQGQPTGVLWAKRNRSPEERARIRAIVSLKSLVAQHLAPRDFEFDWRGRFWAQGVSVLAHVDQKQPTDGALLLLDVRGEETGWWVPGPLLAQVLKISLDDLHAHFRVDGKPYEGGRGKRRTQAHKPELVAGTWNLHGKGVTDLQDLWPGNVVFPDILLLQELGACPEATPEVQVSTLFLGPKVYQMYLVGAPEAHRCQAVLIRNDCAFHATRKVGLQAGLYLHGLHGNQRIACVHLPHSKRASTEARPSSSAEEVWGATLEQLDSCLGGSTPEDDFLIGGDFNQDLHAGVDSFVGMGMLRSLILKYSLELHKSVGATWGARGVDSEIDAILLRAPRVQLRAYKRDDMKQALPSDHAPVFRHARTPGALTYRGRRPTTRCGRWLPDVRAIEEYAGTAEEFCPRRLSHVCSDASRVPSLRYRDSPDLKSKIAARRLETDPVMKASMLAEIRHQRGQDRAEHKLQILQRARSGDRQAISYLRRSAAQASFETSYIEARGGQARAVEEMRQFYVNKYATLLPPPTPQAIERLLSTHMSVRPQPFSQEELQKAVGRCKSRTSAGLDGVCYEAIQAYHRVDKEQKLLQFMNKLLFRQVQLPSDWHEAKVVLLPKTPKPSLPSELRPICLSPCLSKIFGRLIMTRVATRCPPYSSGQMGCRARTQTVDGILAAQTVIGVLRRKYQMETKYQVEAHVAKLDIKAAFDSLSHASIVHYLLHCQPSSKALLLWRFVSNNRLRMSLGTDTWQVAV